MGFLNYSVMSFSSKPIDIKCFRKSQYKFNDDTLWVKIKNRMENNQITVMLSNVLIC